MGREGGAVTGRPETTGPTRWNWDDGIETKQSGRDPHDGTETRMKGPGQRDDVAETTGQM